MSKQCQTINDIYERARCPLTATAQVAIHYPCGCKPDMVAYGCGIHAADPIAYCGYCGQAIVKSEPVAL